MHYSNPSSWTSVSEPTIDGRLLVNFGDAPVSTLLNLLELMRETARQ